MSKITPVTHTEKVVAGQVEPVTHFEKVIAEYGGGNVYENLEAGTNILIEETADGKAKISASGEVSSEDTVARAEIAAIKDGTNIDSFGDVETALGDKQNTISDLSTIRSGAALGATAVQPETGKGLSTNDYTTAEKTKLAGIAEGAEVNEIEGIKVNNTTINPDANKVVNITVPTSAADVSALPDTTKYAAALSLTINSSTFVMTGQLKDQNGDNLGTAQTIDLPLESVVVGGSYNSQTKKVVLTLQNGNTIEFSVADLVSGLQTELSASNKLNPAYINYDSTHRAVSDTEKSTWNSKQNAIDSSHKLSADLVDDTNATNKFATAEELEQIQTNKNNISTLSDGKADKPIYKDVVTEITTTTAAISGLDTSLAANKPYLLAATLFYGNSSGSPAEIIIKADNSVIATATNSATMTSLTCTGLYYKEGTATSITVECSSRGGTGNARVTLCCIPMYKS